MPRRKRNLAAYRAVAARADGCCERCGGKAEVMHHKRLRSQLGADSLLNLCHICVPCHQHIHASPEESYRDGWLISARWHGKEVFEAHGEEMSG